ncbi:hypothetical protein D9615_006092 [Tricholomella constricta]|uniref:Aldehyde dehydrogenase domain-containing protein n=1 Tax=Tricholomella constricta TaxID=117010 RepID=A0A8H5M3F6_9AGAR|nr:hypothetical protein D9615_006092 [Tricholomella constricta]
MFCGNLDEALEYVRPSCAKGVHALRQTKFASFPEVLVVHAKKFQLVNWVPSKLDIPVALPPTTSVSSVNPTSDADYTLPRQSSPTRRLQAELRKTLIDDSTHDAQARRIQVAGFPAGVVNIVKGFGQQYSRRRYGFTRRFCKKVFLDSTAVGRTIMRASGECNLKPVMLEPGGKSPNIVLADADLETAAKWPMQESFLARVTVFVVLDRGSSSNTRSTMVLEEAH